MTGVLTATFKLLATTLVLLNGLSIVTNVHAFKSYQSLGGLDPRQVERIVPTLDARVPPRPPGPPRFTGTKLVDDCEHPWRPLRNGDIRGPCPGLNTLASHGYLPRDGVATPSQIIEAVQEGYNMNNQIATVTTFIAHLMDGNVVTDLLSIGEKTRRTGPDPPSPAIVGGISNHGTFEGDASMTRGDAFFGDNHSFNQTLFDQLVDFSNRFGGGFYNLTVAGELRHQRIQQSIATNPTFSLVGLRHITAFGETTFPVNLFTDGRQASNPTTRGQLTLSAARSFFKDMRFPTGFFRAAVPSGNEGIEVVFAAHPIEPGRNHGVNNYVVDTSLGSLSDPCGFYTGFVNTTIKGLYPNPTGVLRRNLNINLQFLYDALSPPDCPQVFPYGRN
ncbi:aromatic peroxygenase precursor [Coprinopsis marcescibilis]|uniref:Aromatic peroxygenase n=1 Tax=Coprinopsis marcescibilis TaxID=230819 RepID=A0A5C3KLM1_COPMA|nr:aromatic peroxygenase precursor [Coprinopsis marcescibilis]